MASKDINESIPRLTFQNVEKEIGEYVHKNREILDTSASSGLEVFTKIKK
jgi:hypothetical protein